MYWKNGVSASEYENKNSNWIVTQNYYCVFRSYLIHCNPTFDSTSLLDLETSSIQSPQNAKCMSKCFSLISKHNKQVIGIFCQLSFISSFLNSSLFIATYDMSLHQPSFNQKAYLWKKHGTIIYGQPWEAPSSFTASQLVPSLHRVIIFNMLLCLFSFFLIFFPLNW